MLAGQLPPHRFKSQSLIQIPGLPRECTGSDALPHRDRKQPTLIVENVLPFNILHRQTAIFMGLDAVFCGEKVAPRQPGSNLDLAVYRDLWLAGSSVARLTFRWRLRRAHFDRNLMKHRLAMACEPRHLPHGTGVPRHKAWLAPSMNGLEKHFTTWPCESSATAGGGFRWVCVLC